MQGIRLEQNALKIQLAKELLQHRPFVVLPGGVAGLAVALRLLRSSWPRPRRRSTA